MTDQNQLLHNIERKRIAAAEQAVIDSIPADLMEHLRKSQAAFEEQGGCPGCGSLILAVHKIPCEVSENDIY